MVGWICWTNLVYIFPSYPCFTQYIDGETLSSHIWNPTVLLSHYSDAKLIFQLYLPLYVPLYHHFRTTKITIKHYYTPCPSVSTNHLSSLGIPWFTIQDSSWFHVTSVIMISSWHNEIIPAPIHGITQRPSSHQPWLAGQDSISFKDFPATHVWLQRVDPINISLNRFKILGAPIWSTFFSCLGRVQWKLLLTRLVPHSWWIGWWGTLCVIFACIGGHHWMAHAKAMQYAKWVAGKCSIHLNTTPQRNSTVNHRCTTGSICP